MTDEIDLIADLNAQDDDGFGWSTLADARSAGRIVPGSMVLAGNASGRADNRRERVFIDTSELFPFRPAESHVDEVGSKGKGGVDTDRITE